MHPYPLFGVGADYLFVHIRAALQVDLDVICGIICMLQGDGWFAFYMIGKVVAYMDKDGNQGQIEFSGQ